MSSTHDALPSSAIKSSPVFDQALAQFLANNDVGIVSVSLTAIVNILKNIAMSPKDPKLRMLQKSNKNILYKITNPPGCRELMSAMGWTSTNDSYVLPTQVPLSTLAMMRSRLETQLDAAEKVIDEIPRFVCHPPKEMDVAVPLVSSARFEVCVGSSIGRRPTMEDEVVVVGMGPAHNPNEDFFAVFDGHGGRDAAVYAAKNLYLKIGRNFSLNPSEPLKSITRAFEETNAWMMQQRMGSGSTAAMSFVAGSTLYTANVGDTRVVLGWKDRKAVRLSFDHKPSVAAEKERIERLGGEVTKKFGVARVNGVLGVSRAFGDCKLVPYVSAVPHVNILELTDETMFLIIACDGLWDEFSDQEAVELVFEKANTVQNIGEYLSNMAIMRGSQDNVSVVVVFLNPRAALYEEEEEEEDDDETDSEVDSEDSDAPNGSNVLLIPSYRLNDGDPDDDDEYDEVDSIVAAALADQMGKKSPIRRSPSPNTSGMVSNNSSAHSSTASLGHTMPSAASFASAIHHPGASTSNPLSSNLSHTSLGSFSSSSISSMRNSSLHLNNALTNSSGSNPASAPITSSAEFLTRPSFRAKMVAEVEDSSDSEDDGEPSSGGLGVAVNAWMEDDSE